MARLMSQIRLDGARERCRSETFQPALESLDRSARAFMSAPLAPSSHPAGFYHDYFCPDHAVELLFDARRPTTHTCPADGRVFSGEPYDSAWRWFVNNRLSVAAFELAFLYCITGDDALRDRAAEILTDYARRYPLYPAPAEREYGRGRATFQSLDEAVWLIPLIRAYDLLSDALGAQMCTRIENDLIRPAALHLVGEKYFRLHNIECWHNTAIGAAGLCLNDEDLIRLVIEDDFGFRHQLAEGITDDGLWWEGSSSYHFYALAALMTMAQVFEEADDSLCNNRKLRSMFRAPVDMVSGSQLRLPATNDCWFFCSLLGDVCHGVPQAASFYEVACSWYGDAAFAWVLKQNYRSAPRTSVEALLYGADLATAESAYRPRPALFDTSGMALLRSGDSLETETSVLLKYGPHGGSHGHPDKLAVSLWSCGVPLALDLGTPGYGIGLNESWYRQTVSHNTVVVDGRSQPPATGQLIAFDGSGPNGLAIADARVHWEDSQESYAGVAMRRTLLSAGDYWVDVFEVSCDRRRQIDWVCHFCGDLETPPAIEGAPIHLQGDGFEHVAQPAALDSGDQVDFRWRLARGTFTLFLPFEQGTQLIAGKVPANPASERRDVLIRRRRAQATTFVARFFPACEAEPQIEDVVVCDPLQSGPWAFWVHAAERRDLWVIGRRTLDLEILAERADRVFAYDLATQ